MELGEALSHLLLTALLSVSTLLYSGALKHPKQLVKDGFIYGF